MKTLRFNTNIKCADCQQKVAESFNKERRILSFKVDLQDPKRPIEVSTTDGITEAEVQSLIQQAGYQAQPIQSGGFLKNLFPK